MRMKIYAAGMAFLLGGCASSPYRPISVTQDVSDAAKIAVLETLKDPTSAQFGDHFGASTAGRFIRVCGMVNAKNSFGGFTGMQVFSVLYDPETKKARYEPDMSTPFGCALMKADGYSTLPASVLKEQGIANPKEK